MNSSRQRIVLRLACAALLAAMMIVAILKQQALGAARAEHEALLTDSREAERLAVENRELGRLRAEHEEVIELIRDNEDLPKLRNDVRQLRRQAEEAESLRAENQRLLAAMNGPAPAPPHAADFVARAALRDAGLASPEAAVQTVFWAMCAGNLDRLAQCHLNGRQSLNTDLDWQRRRMAEDMKSFTGFQIASRRDVSVEDVIVVLQSFNGGPTTEMEFRRVGEEWKLVD